MKILFLDQYNQLAGAQQCLLDLIDGMPRDGLFAAVAGTGPLTGALRKLDVFVYELPEIRYAGGRKSSRDIMRFPLDLLRMTALVESIVSTHGIDLVYVNGPRLVPAAALATRNLVFHAHSYLDKRYTAAMVRWCLRSRHARVIASSRFVAQPLPGDRVRVIYNGVRELPFQPRRRCIPRVGMVGRIAPEKGQIDFVRAIRVLALRGSHAEYRIHGAPLFSDSNYFARVQELANGLPVHFPGWSANVEEIFAGLDLLVVPSTPVDNTPRVIMEAFAAGVPVIAYPSGGIPELIEDGVTGILTHSLPDAIEALLSHPEKMHAMALAARQVWEERFTTRRYVHEVREFLGTSPGENTTPQASRAAMR